MKLFKKKDKTNNSLMTLLRKLKRHDTMVVAIAVVIALMLCGSLIYISTPVVAAEAKEEFIESERENNELTKEKLQEIRDYLDELDKVVTSNQKSLDSLDEKAASTETKDVLNDSLNQNSKELSNQSQKIKSDTQTIIVETEKIAKETETIARETEKIAKETETIAKETEKIAGSINEKVSALDGKLSDVHKDIEHTITRIDNVKASIEENDNKNTKELREKIELLDSERTLQLKKDFEQIGSVLEKINNDYNEAAAQTKDLLTQLEKNLSERMDQDTDKLIKNGNDNTASLYSKISDMHTQMQSFNTSAFADFRGDIANLSARMDKQLQILSGDIKNYNTDVKNKFDSVNANVSGKFDEVNSNVTGKLDDVNASVTG